MHSADAATFDLLHSDPTLVLLQSGPLLMASWWDAPTGEQMDVVARSAQALEDRLDGPSAYAQFVIAGTPRFTAEVRRKAQEMSGKHSDLGVAHVIEVAGLASAAVRAFLSALILISKGDTPVRVFSSPEDGAVWLAQRLSAAERGWSARRILELRQAALESRP